MFDDAMAGMKVICCTSGNVGRQGGVRVRVARRRGAEDEHLACSRRGMLVLGAAEAPTEMADEYLEMAKNILLKLEMYTSQPTGLSPDHASFPSGGNVAQMGGKTFSDPKTVESLFYLYRKTGDDVYRTSVDDISGDETLSRAVGPGGRGSRRFSRSREGRQDAVVFSGETLKYLYLIFCEDSVMHLDEWVFNTSAPFKMTRDVSTLGSRSAR